MNELLIALESALSNHHPDADLDAEFEDDPERLIDELEFDEAR